MVDWNALADALESARTVPEILDAVARIAYANAHDGAECPPDEIPSETDLAEAIEADRTGFGKAQAQAAELAAAVLPWGDDMPAVERWRWQAMGDPEARKAAEAELREHVGAGIDFDAVLAILESHGAIVRRPRLVFMAPLRIDASGAFEPGAAGGVWELAEVHQRWMAVRETDPEARHPLAPLVVAWLARPVNRDPFNLRSRASLPRLHRIEPSEAAQLPAFPGSNLPEPGRQLDLPGFGSSVEGCPSWLLWMFDAAGGESMKQGRGAPWPMRMFVGALLHVEIRARTGQWVTLRFPHLRRHESDWPVPGVRAVETWLHPEVWTNFRRDWPRLPAALDSMRERLSYVPVAGFGSVAMVFPSVIPRSACDPFVEFTVRIPASAARGARLDWPLLCRYGLESAAQYRALPEHGRLLRPFGTGRTSHHGGHRRSGARRRRQPEAA